MSAAGLCWCMSYPFGFFIMPHSDLTRFDSKRHGDRRIEIALEAMAINPIIQLCYTLGNEACKTLDCQDKS